jgi:hypothetical protein
VWQFGSYDTERVALVKAKGSVRKAGNRPDRFVTVQGRPRRVVAAVWIELGASHLGWRD